MNIKSTLLASVLTCMGIHSFAQSHTITIHSNNRAASLLMSSSEYQSYVSNDGFNDNTTRQNLVKEIYQKFNDDFDFVFLVLNETQIPSNLTYYGELIKVSNNTSGLGMNNYSFAADYGSKGKLQSVIALTALTYAKFGPTLHEIAHNWGNFAIQTATFQNGQGFDNYIPHWGFTGGNTKGQLGGFTQSSLVVKGNITYEVEAFGSFANGGNGLPYNQLELYLMGMIPAAEVSDFDVFSGITAASDGSNGKIEFVASTRTTWTAAKLAQDLGARNPSSVNAQKKFKALFVVVTPTPLTETQWTTIDEQVGWFGEAKDDGTSLYNFWEATGGRASIETGGLDLATGIHTMATDKHDYLSVSPNPANDLIRLSTTDGQVMKKIIVYNTIGQFIMESNADAENYELNIATIKSGFYTIQIELANGSFLYSRLQVLK
jgi:hypothetical protein